jgi:hypothetical protein
MRYPLDARLKHGLSFLPSTACFKAMLKWHRGKKRDYTSEEIDGSGEKLRQHRTKADLRARSISFLMEIHPVYNAGGAQGK